MDLLNITNTTEIHEYKEVRENVYLSIDSLKVGDLLGK